ncbi:DUF2752 domain-containing protein [Gordonia sp. PP30]|uniref:DUF2752 domain-containing protein n=1 Tax=unclassified Gordonia (in: high G+C Gram-positive bacteria) TaxID=2657482 RepID=UPI001FFEFDF7|nr:DUF2752 domain-containing protein [Gordonia sp. PP30]UQE75703.1 DUF2752 domain-containing protein [Gordonia sp. PP30]
MTAVVAPPPPKPANRAVAAFQKVARHRIAGPATILAGVAAAGTFIWFADPSKPGGIMPVCPTHALLGIDCPGCGMSRAIYYLEHGELGTALHYNAVGVVALALLAVSFVTYTIGLWRGRAVRGWQNWRHTPTVALVVTLVWFVIRNIPIAPFDSLKV